MYDSVWMNNALAFVASESLWQSKVVQVVPRLCRVRVTTTIGVASLTDVQTSMRHIRQSRLERR